MGGALSGPEKQNGWRCGSYLDQSAPEEVVHDGLYEVRKGLPVYRVGSNGSRGGGARGLSGQYDDDDYSQYSDSMSGISSRSGRRLEGGRHRGDRTWHDAEHEKLAFLRQVKAHVENNHVGLHRDTRSRDSLEDDEDSLSALSGSRRSAGSKSSRGSRRPAENAIVPYSTLRGPADGMSEQPRTRGAKNIRSGQSDASSVAGSDYGSVRSDSRRRRDAGRSDDAIGRLPDDDRGAGRLARGKDGFGSGNALAVQGNSALDNQRMALPYPVLGASLALKGRSGPIVPDSVADLESKLNVAQSKVEEATERWKKEEQRAAAAEKKLQQSRSAAGSSDLEYQLMTNLVALRARCMELEEVQKAEISKAQAAEERLDTERRGKNDVERALTDAEVLKSQLANQLDEVKGRATDLEKRKAEQERINKEQEQRLRAISVERDETLVLLERAVDIKEKRERDRQQKVDEANRELDRLRGEADREQREVQSLLSSVDHLLVRLGRGDQTQTVDELRELVYIRDGMRQLVKAREKPADDRHRSSLPSIRERVD
mmetsp:Transcript_69233/g.150669  ORF Transcript_69233/g.150669 Transcript_69233/m.150669 type:complete len:544 (-) Transcript_69233:40-1671(-)